jgi:hypothetical protein
MTLQERRKQEKRKFIGKVCLLLTLMSVVAYGAWFAPWTKNLPEIPVERVR